jgi:hypothetical protein
VIHHQYQGCPAQHVRISKTMIFHRALLSPQSARPYWTGHFRPRGTLFLEGEGAREAAARAAQWFQCDCYAECFCRSRWNSSHP